MMRRRMLLSMLLIPFIGTAKSQESKEISTPAGTVSVTSTVVSPVPQQIVPLEAGKLRKINELDEAAMHFLVAYRPGTTPSLKTYDEAFRLWQRDESPRFSIDDVVVRLGAYLGNRLVKDFDMEWVEVTDEYGIDLAVRSRKFEVMSFPLSSVAKRIKNNEYDFMVGVYYAVQDAIASGAKER